LPSDNIFGVVMRGLRISMTKTLPWPCRHFLWCEVRLG
jgi:hypothetical protein